MSRVLPKSGGALCDVQGYERPALTAGHRLLNDREAVLANETRLVVTERTGALVLIDFIVRDFDIVTMKQAGRGSGRAIGWAGQRVFGVLAEKPGAFLLPVPFDREEVSIAAGYADRTIAKAMKRLVEQELVTMSGFRGAPMFQLHLPPHVVAAYRQHAARAADHFGDPFDDDEIGHALELLDG